MIRKLFIVFLSIIFVSPLFSSTDPQTRQIIWAPEGAIYARFGFSGHPISKMTDNPAGDDGSPAQPAAIWLNSRRREGDSIIATNSSNLYAFWQIYGEQRFYIYISAEDMKTSSGTSSIGYTVSWNETVAPLESTADGSGARLLYTFDTSETASASSEKLIIETVLEDGLQPEIYTGYIRLELRKS